MRGKDGIPPIYLPCDQTKKSIHKMYRESCQLAGHVSMGLTTFQNLWRAVCPHIQFMKPRTDVCPTCEKLSDAIKEARSEDDKLKATQIFSDHLLYTKTEREWYNSCVEEARQEMEASPPGPSTHPAVPCSADLRRVHFTFDFSQCVHIPHHSRQVGPLYFLNPRKVQLFGVAMEGVRKQLNFLIDENETMGINGTSCKGPNSVLSMLDHALGRWGLGEKEIVLHADNCAGKCLHFI